MDLNNNIHCLLRSQKWDHLLKLEQPFEIICPKVCLPKYGIYRKNLLDMLNGTMGI